MFGDDFLVAPALDSDINTLNVYLPNDKGVEWVHIWSNDSYEANGRWININADIGYTPIFFKKGSEWGLNI